MARRLVLIAGIAVVLVLGAAQLLLPGYAANRIEDRLTEGGGTATATVSAFPAARLAFGDGDRLDVSGSGLDLPLDEDERVFGDLDGFDRVQVHLDDFAAGPFAVSSFELTRDGQAPYHVITSATTTAADLVGYGAGRLGIPGAPLFRFFAGRTAAGHRTIPVRLDMALESDDGRVRVVSGGGTVAGYPAGPLAELITAAIVVRL